MADALTVKEVALKAGAEAKTLRKFLRSEVVEAGGTVGVDTPGKGKRYSFDPEDLEDILERFEAWQEAKAPKSETEDDEELEDSEEEIFEDLDLEV